MWYATGDAWDGFKWFSFSLLGVPYLWAFYESPKVAVWYNKNNVIAIYSCMTCALEDERKKLQGELENGLINQEQLEKAIFEYRTEQQKRCNR